MSLKLQTSTTINIFWLFNFTNTVLLFGHIWAAAVLWPRVSDRAFKKWENYRSLIGTHFSMGEDMWCLDVLPSSGISDKLGWSICFLFIFLLLVLFFQTTQKYKIWMIFHSLYLKNTQYEPNLVTVIFFLFNLYFSWPDAIVMRSGFIPY